jgi:uracil-DNA glycosylase
MNEAPETGWGAMQLLRWYQAMGVDEAVADTPQDWSRHIAHAPIVAEARPEVAKVDTRVRPEPPFISQTSPLESRSASQRTTTPSSQPIARATPTMAPDAFALAARDLARQAPDLAALEAALTSFDGCPLKKTAKNTCFARGRPNTGLMLIGEAPGRDEDLQGQPFVGRAGQLLDRMLAAIGFGPDDIYITNVVYWRPPGNRTPTPQEVQACQPFLERQIELVAPEVLLLLGGAAAKQVLGTDEGIMKLRGKWKTHEASGRSIRTMATLHPAYLLRNPSAKRHAWRDLLTVKAALNRS